MAEETTDNKSKFLDWQDQNGDGLIDKCDDLIDVVPTNKCPTCRSDPNYISPNWRDMDENQPWLNEKFCKYQIVVQTTEQTLTDPSYGEDLNGLFATYVEAAIDGLIVGFDKADTEENRSEIASNIEFQKYYLDARPTSYVKLLYSIDFDIFANLPNMEEEDDDSEEEEDDESPIVVEMEADLIKQKLIRVRKAFNLYSRYYRVLSAIEGGKLIFSENNTLYSIAQFSRYGDAGMLPTSLLAKALTSLDGFLNDKGLNIFGVGSLSFGRDRVTKIEFKFSPKYELKRLRVWTIGCGGKPKVYKKKRLAPLLATSSWSDKTCVAYFAQVDKIDTKLQAREAPHWLDVVTEFTYPKVYQTFNWPEQTAPEPNTALSCMGDALANQLGELGQDILDEVFSLGDALAYRFNKNLCAASIGEVVDNKRELGLIPDPSDIDDPKNPKNLMSMATEQAFKQLIQDEQVFVSLCARIVSSIAPQKFGLAPSSQQTLDLIYAEGLDRLKLCGLFELSTEALTCLMAGLSLEDALSRIIKAALRSMSIDNLGDFFLGLPPDKQAELEALVEKKLNEGDLFKDASGPAAEGGGQVVSDTVSGKLKWSPPWKESKEERKKRKANEDSPEGDPNTFDKNKTPLTKAQEQESAQVERRTLAQQFDAQKNAKDELSPNIVLEAYILALLEVYGDDPLGIVDMLNKYPGAQMLAKVIAMFDCPRPPLFNPNMLDFLKDFDLPWCRQMGDLTLPKLQNPFHWIPKLADWTGLLWELIKLAIQKIILAILVKILVKLCQIIGDAICKALEVTGQLVASLPAVATGKTTFREVIRDTICGNSASDEQIDDTMAEMFEKLGVGGAALADKQAVVDFTSDLSSAVTRREMHNAFLGEMSPDMATAAYNLIQFEYPQFSDAFPTRESIGDFMSNVGTLIPPELQQAMRDFNEGLDDDDMMPSNPSLCASPEQLDDFQDLRCALLEGRATPEHCRQMFDDIQNDLGDDLEQISSAMQNGFFNPDQLPPLISKPGCDDGIIPFEAESQQSSAKIALGAELKALKKEYAEDMLGNGGFLQPQNYGLLNMVLSDTMGQPLTAHWRKANNRINYVDFATEGEVPDETKAYFFFNDPPDMKIQRGNYPYKVAPWLQKQFKELSVEYISTNDWQSETTTTKTFEELGFEGLFGGIDIDRISIPDLGYNVEFTSNISNETMTVTTLGRKETPDTLLEFRDNNKGRRSGDASTGTPFSYGFDIGVYNQDLTDEDSRTRTVSHIGNPLEPLDSCRIKIENVFNPAAATPEYIKALMTKEELEAYEEEASEDDPYYDLMYEFLAIDDTFDGFADTEEDTGLGPAQYPNFSQCFDTKAVFSPQTYLLSDMIKSNSGDVPSLSVINGVIDSVTAQMFSTFSNEISNNEKAWLYGAKYDTLNEEDALYVVQDGQTRSPGGTEYNKAEIEIEDKDGSTKVRKIRNSDMIMGVSMDQYRNQETPENIRVFYLDPTTYGGSYVNPAIHIKPLKYDGYLGMVNTMFPDFSPCKPRNTDLVDFQSIEDEISTAYNSIPEDQRLQGDPDCVTEVPYNRILNRPAKAAIQGLIRAAARIYASVHFLKSYATFTVFKPDFTNNYSSIFSQYVVEVMEKDFRDAQGAFWEFFNTFKDDEFWYAFLEQSVQTYGRLVDDGTIVDPPEPVLRALFRINDAQESYKYPKITDTRNDVEQANELEETDAPYRWPLKSIGLKKWRMEKNLNAVRATEEDAKIILKEFIKQELDYVSKKFLDNLKGDGVEPKYNDMGYFILTNMCQGALSLDLDKEIVETAVGLPMSGEEHYTSGGELGDPDGNEYVGYYHTHEDQDGNIIYMAGEFHTAEAHDELNPFANKIVVPIGDVTDYSSSSSFSDSTSRPFVIEKYMSINGVKMKPSEAIDTVRHSSEDLLKNVSDIYPGDMELVLDPNSGEVVGIKGQLGVRYGLLFSIVINGNKYELVSSEMDALDTKIGQIAPFSGDSKLLLCLINQLKNTKEFGYIANYIFSMKKILSILAIYNDMAFLPSIGEMTAADGASFTRHRLGTDVTFDEKPGAKVKFPNSSDGDFTPDYNEGLPSNDYWVSVADRTVFTPFNLDYDDWQQVLLRNSKSRIKKLFKQHYHARDWDPNKQEGTDFAAIVIKNLKASLMPPPRGKRILPWFRRRNIRDNPFNSKGELCTKPEN